MIQAVIFDLDGTVLDNELTWEEAFATVAAANNIPKSKSWMKNGWWHEPGIGITPNWRKYGYEGSLLDQLTDETRKIYKKLSGNGSDILVNAGLVDLVETIKDRGWLTALCTSSSWNMVEKELEDLGLYLAFDITTTGEEVLAEKPDPEIYMLTAQKLGLDPQECVVVEDAIAGIKAGAAAGCRVAGLISDYAPVADEKKAGADWTVQSLAELGPVFKDLDQK